MLKRLVVTVIVLTVLFAAVFAVVLNRPVPVPRTYDVRGAVRQLPVNPEASLEQKELARQELTRSRERLTAFKSTLQAPAPAGDLTELEGQLASFQARLKLADPATLGHEILELRKLWIRGRTELLETVRREPDPDKLPPMPLFDLQAYGVLRGTDEAESYLSEYEATQKALVDHFRHQRATWEQTLTARLILQGALRDLRGEYLALANRRGVSLTDLGGEDFLQAIQVELDTLRLKTIHKGLLFRLHVSRDLQAGRYVAILTEMALPVLALSLILAVVMPGAGRITLQGRQGQILSGLFLFATLRLAAAALSQVELMLELGALSYLAANLALYRVVRRASEQIGLHVVRTVRFRDSSTGRRLVTASLAWLAGLLLLRDSLLELVRLLTVRGLLYWTVEAVFDWVLLAFYIALAYRWRSEIVFQLQSLAGPRRSASLAWLEQPAAALVLMPFLFPVWLGMDLIFGLVLLLQRTEFGRRLAAGAMRHYVESLRGRTLVPRGAPADYAASFLATRPPIQEVMPLCDPTFLPRLTGRFEAWLEQPGSANNRLTLVGRKGSGVTSLVDYLEQIYRERVQFARVTLHDRQLGLFQALASALQLDSVPDNLEQVAELLRQRPATILVVENFHFLFLSALGGFQSLRDALLLARLTPHNVFWMFTGGYHAQAYLNRVLAADFVIESWLQVPLWSERALRKAILEAHASSGLKLAFDPDLGSFPEETGADEGLETQYFRILWEHSGGNPSTARQLYLRSLDPCEDGLIATVPPSNQMGRLQAAPTALHLVLAAVVRHQGLTEGEVVRVTDLHDRLVQLSLMQALEWGILERDQRGLHTVHPAWVKDLEVLLKRKNMLYAL